MSDKIKSDVILHEMLHTATVYAMSSYNTAIRGGATSELPKHIYKSCKEIYRVYAAIRNDQLFAGDYGIKNAREMVASLTNPEFAKTVCKELGLDLGKSEVKQFADGEIFFV